MNERSRPAHERERTDRVVGLAAARAVLETRPLDVLNIAHTKEARSEVAGLLREAARRRIAYREVTREELSRIADTIHHEGVCLRVRAQQPMNVVALIGACERGGFVLALDRVENPHNVGALLRSAAFFGASALLLGGETTRLGPATVRVAEGGAEYVKVCLVPELATALDELAEAGFAVVGADAHQGTSLTRFSWPKKSVLVLGSEREGLTRAVAKRCTKRVHIEGAGRVESLNVSVAAGILMASAARALHGGS